MKRKFIWWLGFVTLFVLFSVTAYGDSWPTVNRDFARTGANGASVDPSTLTLDWFFTPGVGNSLGLGLPGGTGFPAGKGGQSPVIGFGKVVYLYLDTSLAEVLVGLDASTGALLWADTVRPQGLGFFAVQPPTIAERDTGLASDTVVYIGGTNNSFRCYNAVTGALIWNKTGLSGNMRNGNLVFDTLVIAADNSSGGTQRKLTALNTRNGSVVWTSASLDGRTFSALSISNDTIFACTRPLGAPGFPDGGSVYAIDAKTGATLTQFDDPNERNYSNDIVVFGRGLVTASRNELAVGLPGNVGPYASFVRFSSHDVNGAKAVSGGNAFGFDRFSIPSVYKDPSTVAETVAVIGTSGGGALGWPGELVMRRVMNGPGGVAFRAYAPTVAAIHGMAAAAAGGITPLVFVGDDAGVWYVKDGNGYGVGFAGLGPYWHKVYPGHITAGTAISPDDDTLVVVLDGNGNVAGWHNGHVASRPRAQTYLETITDGFGIDQLLPRTVVAMNIIPTDGVTGTGGTATETVKVFMNSGNEILNYDLDWGSSLVSLAASDLGGLSASISLGRTNPTRERMANVFADDNAITAGTGFMEKKYDLLNQSFKQIIDLEAEGISSFKEIRDFQAKTSYFGTSKLQEAREHMVATGWLFVNSLSGGNPSPGSAAPGDTVELILHATNPGGFGQFFGEIKMFNTNEPDVQGNPLDTTRMPVVLVIGFLGERCLLESYNGELLKTNYGRDMCQDASIGFVVLGSQVGFDGGFELGNSDTTFAGLFPSGAADPVIASATTGWKSDSTCEISDPYTFISSDGLDTVEIASHFTKLAHVTGLPLLVRQYGWAMKNAVTPYAGDVFYQALVVSCTGSVAVDSVKLGAWADLDVHNFGANEGNIIANKDVVWQWDTGLDNELIGIARVPGDNINVSGTTTLWTSTHDPAGRGNNGGPAEWLPHDGGEINTLFNSGFKGQLGTGPEDFSSYNGNQVVSLAPGEHITVTYMWWGLDTDAGTGDDTAQIQDRLREWLAIAGYYRGDVDLDGDVDIVDFLKIDNYIGLFYSGPNRPKPFPGQADVNNDGVITDPDVELLIDYVLEFPDKPAPIDKDRFLPDAYRNVRPGLTNDTNWKP